MFDHALHGRKVHLILFATITSNQHIRGTPLLIFMGLRNPLVQFISSSKKLIYFKACSLLSILWPIYWFMVILVKQIPLTLWPILLIEKVFFQLFLQHLLHLSHNSFAQIPKKERRVKSFTQVNGLLCKQRYALFAQGFTETIVFSFLFAFLCSTSFSEERCDKSSMKRRSIKCFPNVCANWPSVLGWNWKFYREFRRLMPKGKQFCTN